MTGITSWLARHRADNEIQVDRLPWSRNEEWGIKDGALVHRTGRFFSVRGYHCQLRDTQWEDTHLPLIDQPEVGLLAFIVRRAGDGYEWLLQAKAEPGTEDFVQVGPSVQATKSNYERAHGGESTRFLEVFLRDGKFLVPISLQTEQGTRFFKKKNGNAIAIVDDIVLDHSTTDWQWFRSAELRDALLADFEINTDARSVIMTGDWSLISETGHPFSKSTRPEPFPGFVGRLRASLERVDEGAIPTQITCRDDVVGVVPLDQVSGWRFGEDSFVPTEGQYSYDIVSYSISAPGREVTSWHQPLLRGKGRGREILVLAEQDGCLKMLLRDSIEPGFAGAVGLGSSFSTEGMGNSWVPDALAAKTAMKLAHVLQSDEGGRFMRAIASYEVCWIDSSVERPGDDGTWVTLGEARRLVSIEGLLTNEARSLISILLAWA